MSNPIGTKPTNITGVASHLTGLISNVTLTDARFMTLEQQKAFRKQVKTKWSLDEIYNFASRSAQLRPWSAVPTQPCAEYIMNPNVALRRFFNSSGGPIELSRTSLPAAFVQGLMVSLFPGERVELSTPSGKVTVDLDSYLNDTNPTRFGLVHHILPPHALVADVSANTFFAKSGTLGAMGRLKSATAHKNQRIVAITDYEKNEAWTGSGYISDTSLVVTIPEVFMKPWPFYADSPSMFGERIAQVKIPRASGLGVPVCKGADDPEAMEKAVELAKMLLNDPRFDTPAGAEQANRILMVTHPWLVALTGKVKTDAYSRTKLMEQKMRLYAVVGAGPRLVHAAASQPLGGHKATLVGYQRALVPDGYRDPPYYHKMVTDMGDLKSAQGVSPTGEGASLMVASLDSQVEKQGYGYLTCGDDMLIAIKAKIDGVMTLITFNGDATNFDLTQTELVNYPFIDMLRARMAKIHPRAANMWAANMKEKLVIVAGWATMVMKGPLASGMSKVSEINDLVAQAFLVRFFRSIRGHFTQGPLPHYSGDVSRLEIIFKQMGGSMGLEMKFEEYKTTPIPWENYDELYLIHRLVVEGRLSLKFLGHHILAVPFITDDDYYIPVRRIGETLHSREKVAAELIKDGDFTHQKYVGIGGVLDMMRIVPSMQYGDGRYIEKKSKHELTVARSLISRLAAIHPWGINYAVGDQIVRSMKIVQATVDQHDDAEQIDTDDTVDFVGGALIMESMTAGALKKFVTTCIDTAEFALFHKAIPMDDLSNPSKMFVLDPIPDEVGVEQPRAGNAVTMAALSHWADEMDEDELAEAFENYKQLFPDRLDEAKQIFPNSDALALRPTTKRNFGTNPPSVPVRHTISNVTGSRSYGAEPAKLSKSQRKRANRARRNRAEYVENDDRSVDESLGDIDEGVNDDDWE